MTSPKHSKIVTRPIEDPEVENPIVIDEPEVSPRGRVPSIGRIVHYTHTSRCTAAIVTSVNDEKSVNLTIFLDEGLMIHQAHVQLGEGEGLWHWPELLVAEPVPTPQE